MNKLFSIVMVIIAAVFLYFAVLSRELITDSQGNTNNIWLLLNIAYWISIPACVWAAIRKWRE